MRKHFKGWELGFFHMSFTYDGLLIGKPSPMIDKMILDGAESQLKSLRFDEDNHTVIEKRLDSGALKPVLVKFELLKHEPQVKGVIVTFCDMSDSMEDVIQRVIDENPNFKTVEWDY